MMEPSLFDTLRGPPIITAIDCDAPWQPFKEPVAEVLTLPRKKTEWKGCNLCEIKLHPWQLDGETVWMWSTSFATFTGDCYGAGYGINPHNRQFAHTRDDALFFAVREVQSQLAGRGGADVAAITKWVDALL
jgi:hypothetical protein